MRFHTLMKFTWVNIAWHTIYTCEKCENASFESSDFVSSSFSKMPIDMIHLQRLPLPKQRVRATRCPWQCQLCPRSWCCQCHTPVKFNIGKKTSSKIQRKNQVSEANIVEFIWASLPYKPNSSKFELLLWPESDKHWQMLYDVFPTHLFFRIEPSSTQIALIGFVFCKIFQLLLPVTQGLLSSRPPWPPRIQRRIFPSKSKVIL